MKIGIILNIGLAALVLAGCRKPTPGAGEGEPDPAEVAVGERLFREGRFSQFFASHASGVNAALSAGAPEVQQEVTLGAPLAGPYKGGGMACAACHLVDEVLTVPGGGMRAYNDFARRTPIPDRGDGRQVTVRNTPTMVNATLPHAGNLFLHYDGQFRTGENLVRAAFTGRNFGWLAGEEPQAMAQVARVVREDDGKGTLAAQYGALPYAALFGGTDVAIPEELLLPERYRLDTGTATDAEIFDRVAELVSAYLDSLRFAQDEDGVYTGSAYDRFLAKNHLPQKPFADEAAPAYVGRLSRSLELLSKPEFVTPADGTLTRHSHPFQFGDAELRGLRTFLGAGNCAACHTPPDFTDFGFHNTGAAQAEYDAHLGEGAFAALEVPGLAQRTAHPEAMGAFLSLPDQAGHTDLGLWNVFANPAQPVVQLAQQETLCDQLGLTGEACTPEAVLPQTIGLFKTPPLRDLGHTQPYLHTGQLDTLEDVVQHYRHASDLARAGQLRNAAPELRAVTLSEGDVADLAAFLRALDEDYE